MESPLPSRAPVSHVPSRALVHRVPPQETEGGEGRRFKGLFLLFHLLSCLTLQQPKFLSKEERARLALAKREQEIKDQKEKEAKKRAEREALEREAEELRQKELQASGSKYGTSTRC